MHPIIQRMRERKIVQWVLAYLAGAWLVAQVVDSFREPWGWSDRLVQGVHLTLIAGIVLTTVLAWYHGEKGRQRVSSAELLIIAALLFMSGLLGRQFLGRGVDVDPPSGVSESADASDYVPSRQSIAVLPFENLGADVDANLVDGIHDEIQTQLGKIRSLDPRSRTSVEAYRDSSQDLEHIAEELGVRYIVEGTVRRVGDAIRVNVALFEPGRGGRIWAESYNRDLSVAQLLNLQLEIALEVATRIGAEIAPAERALLTVEAPENLAAYESYLQGLSHLRTIEGAGGERSDLTYQRAEQAFQTAIDLEPRWPPPQVLLGRVYGWLAATGINPDANYAREAAWLDSALAIDSLYGPTWWGLALVRLRGERDFVGAEEARVRAEALGSLDHWRRGFLLIHLGRFEDAVESYERAARQDPLSSTVQLQLGVTYFCAGRFQAAAEQLELAREMRGRPLMFLAAAYLKTGRRQEALREIRELRSGDVDPAWLAYLYASLDSIEAAGRFHESAPPDFRYPSQVSVAAAAHVLLEGPEAALEYLEEVEQAAPRSLDVLDCFEEVRGLREQPRYLELLERVGHPGRGSASEN